MVDLRPYTGHNSCLAPGCCGQGPQPEFFIVGNRTVSPSPALCESGSERFAGLYPRAGWEMVVDFVGPFAQASVKFGKRPFGMALSQANCWRSIGRQCFRRAASAVFG